MLHQLTCWLGFHNKTWLHLIMFKYDRTFPTVLKNYCVWCGWLPVTEIATHVPEKL